MKKHTWKQKLIACYEIFYELRRRFILRTVYRLHIMSTKQTLCYIKNHRCSIARFGDGEFDFISNARDQKFQACTPELSQKLKQVLEQRDKNLLLCVPRCMNTVKGCNSHASNFWITWGKKENRHKCVVNMIRKHAGRNYHFGDALITRPYIDWKYGQKYAMDIFHRLQSLWEGKDILIVEGAATCMGIGNDLFDNARSIKRILAPAVGAFDCYNQILNTILAQWNGELILMALGPTATVLAGDLAKHNIQALDIGHIDIEYEWCLRGVKERIAVPGKFTNEAKNGDQVVMCTDPVYQSQIIARIQ